MCSPCRCPRGTRRRLRPDARSETALHPPEGGERFCAPTHVSTRPLFLFLGSPPEPLEHHEAPHDYRDQSHEQEQSDPHAARNRGPNEDQYVVGQERGHYRRPADEMPTDVGFPTPVCRGVPDHELTG